MPSIRPHGRIVYGYRMLYILYCYTGLSVIVILDYHMWTLFICFWKYYFDLLIEHLAEISFNYYIYLLVSPLVNSRHVTFMPHEKKIWFFSGKTRKLPIQDSMKYVWSIRIFEITPLLCLQSDHMDCKYDYITGKRGNYQFSIQW
jgi:hypothetical protein